MNRGLRHDFSVLISVLSKVDNVMQETLGCVPNIVDPLDGDRATQTCFVLQTLNYFQGQAIKSLSYFLLCLQFQVFKLGIYSWLVVVRLGDLWL